MRWIGAQELRRCAAATVLVLCWPGEASAATTLYVDRNAQSCSNTGPGSTATPFCSISAAAAKTTAGTTVLVSSGTYAEQVSVRSGAAGAPVVFEAAPGATVTVTAGKYGFYVSGKTWVTIRGFTVTDTVSDGFHISSRSSGIDVIGNEVRYAGKPEPNMTAKGIAVSDSTDVLVRGNTVDHNSNFGIYLDSATLVEVTGNQSSFNAKAFDRAASGIRLYRSSRNVVSSNVSHDNEDSGIELVSGSNDNLVVNNVTYGNGDHGIDSYNATGQRLVANSVYRNVTAGINVEGGSTGATLANNVSVDNGVNSPRTKGNVRVDSASVSGTTADYSVLDVDASFVLVEWAGVSYGSLSAFTTATGQEAHGIQSDPRWVAPEGGDFRLAPGSPAIDSADSNASGAQAADADGNPRVDDPSTANTGAGLRDYDDRGALEAPPTDLPPAAVLSVTPTGGPTPLQVTGDASGSSDSDATPIASYAFDFGDGTTVGPQSSPTASHTYANPGTYTVVVTVTDTAGLSSIASAQVTATPPPDAPPSAVLALTPHSGPAPLQVTADASGSSDGDDSPIATYTFDFGDGSAVIGPQAGATALHTYSGSGTYTVTVTVTDTAGLSSTASSQVSVTDGAAPPISVLSVSPTTGTAPLEVTADGSRSSSADGSPVATYTFDFGDGSPVVGPQQGPTAGHTYATAGAYIATLTVTDAAGLSSTASTQVTVTAPNLPPNAALTVTPSSGLAPLDVVADASASTDADDGSIATYAFDFGDGTSTGAQPGATATHRYAAPGSYMLTLTVTDNGGLSSTSTTEVTVLANVVGNAGFEANLSGWNASGGDSGVTLARVAGGHSGDWAAELQNPNATAATCVLNDSPNWVKATVPGTYTASLWVRSQTPGAALKLRLREYSGSTLLGSEIAETTLTGSWQQVTVSYTVAAGGASTLDLNAYVVKAAPGQCFAADDAAVYHDPTGEPPPPPPPPPNLIANPGFETDLSGWNASGGDSGVTLARVAGGHSGDWAAKLENPNATAATCVLNDSPNWVKTTQAGTYRASLSVRSDTAGQTFRLRLREYSGSTLVGSATTDIALTTAWQRVTVAYTVGAAGASTLDLNAYVTKAAPGTCAYVDDASLELG